jgi:hypothetical protein
MMPEKISLSLSLSLSLLCAVATAAVACGRTRGLEPPSTRIEGR